MSADEGLPGSGVASPTVLDRGQLCHPGDLEHHVHVVLVLTAWEGGAPGSSA